MYVPVGKQIRINKGIGWPVHIGNWDDNWDNDYYDGEQNIRWQSDVDYVMKADGLYTLDDRKADGSNDKKTKKEKLGNTTNTDGSGDDNYRYNDGKPLDKLDSMKMKLEKEKQRTKDSLEKVKQKIEEQLDKIGESGSTDPMPLSSNTPVYSPVISIN